MELDNYKNHIINFNKYGFTEKNYNRRKRNIERKYTDDFLKNVIENTNDFSIYLLDKIKNNCKYYYEHFFYRIELSISDNKTIKCLTNNCIGHYPCDELFLYNNKYISKHILQNLFGNAIKINLEFEDNDRFDPYIDHADNDRLLCLYIEGSIKDLNEIGNEYSLVKKYKKVDV